ncbi:ester cyclase [Halogeometricum sp. S1BR25-6]|uniref:Ester cyclase n=1 Tax=Halogeometricum salsisoli TaxID=2950536 RepID=A0ABU2GGL9_9EURY|nr:ester cyclase [Halogeometricum sp. S1BR25-6]MDS0299571.1 ester cyclase [Halogeometricum sp. S1BR25-6]
MTATDTIEQTNLDGHRRFADDIWNDHRVETAPEYVHENCVLYDPTQPRPIRGREAFARYLRDTFTAFPDLRVELHEMLAEGDTVVAHYTLTGTHEGPFGRISPTGRRIELEGMSMVRYVDGRIAEERAFVDSATLRRQLGFGFPTVLVTVPRLALRAIRDRR